jgi:hypothetical protein
MLEFDDIQHILLTRVPALTGRYEFLSFRQPQANPSSGNPVRTYKTLFRTDLICHAHRHAASRNDCGFGRSADPPLNISWRAARKRIESVT